MATVTNFAGQGRSLTGYGEFGTDPWLSPGRVTADDASTVVQNNTSLQSAALVCDTFAFAIPTGSTINSILVEAKMKNPQSGLVDSQLVKVASVVGTMAQATANTTTLTYTNLRAAGLWGTTWTPAEINATTFGVSIWGDSSVQHYEFDAVRITIDYTAPASNNHRLALLGVGA